MIYNALNCVVTELNDYLMKKFKTPESKAVLNSILQQDGSISEHCLNRMVLSLVNLEQDTSVPRNPIYIRKNEELDQLNVPFNFNLDVLVCALFTNYDEGLKFLSETIYFLHAKSLFNTENTPSLDPAVRQLAVEVVKLTYHEAHSLWGAMGVKYLPSVLFKARMLSFQSGAVVGRSHEIRKDAPDKVVDPALS